MPSTRPLRSGLVSFLCAAPLAWRWGRRQAARLWAEGPRPRPGRASWGLLLERLEDRTVPSTIFVNTTSDENDAAIPLSPQPAGADMKLSLREAINYANANPATIIDFAIPTADPGYNGQWWTITLTMGSLPTLAASGTTIDGTTQPTFNSSAVVGTGGTVGVDQVPLPQYPKPVIAIDPLQAADGLNIDINASKILVQALSIYDAQDGVYSSYFDGDTTTVGTNRVLNDMFIGVLPNGSDPMTLLPAFSDPLTPPPLLGGTPPRNTGFGVVLDDSGDPSNPAVIPARDSSLTVQNSYVGYNGFTGIDGRENNTGPYCALTITGCEIFKNGWASEFQDGIDFDGENSLAYGNSCHDNTTGTGIPSGEGGNGIELGYYSRFLNPPLPANNVVKDNTVDHNVSCGISDVAGSAGNFIVKNIVFANQVGIDVNQESGGADLSTGLPNTATNQNLISQNSTYLNFGLGIDLEDQMTMGAPWVGFAAPGGRNTLLPPGSPNVVVDGVTPNHPGGTPPATQSNDLQNWPVLTSAVTGGGATSVSGTLNSLPNSTFTIEFFWTPDTDLFAPDDREGHNFLGSKSVTTDALGNASFTFTFNTAVPADAMVFATATVTATSADPTVGAVNDTSEFSNGVAATSVAGEGFVTGGGSINPATVSGTSATNSTDHRANFGFNAKYHDGDPTPVGHTNFNWNPGNIHFDSTSYDMLSLAVQTISTTPELQKATWTGKGTLNHQSGYTFKVQVTDRGEPGTNDSFRIQIKNSAGVIVYDNGADPDVETTLATGNIQIHTKPNVQEAADGVVNGGTDSGSLTQAELDAVLPQAIADWTQAGIPGIDLSALANPSVRIMNLPDSLLGLTGGSVVAISANAAGHGWFTDPSLGATPPAGQMDLLTVVTHELGHLLGYADVPAPGIMSGTLAPGVRLALERGNPPTGSPMTQSLATVAPALATLTLPAPVGPVWLPAPPTVVVAAPAPAPDPRPYAVFSPSVERVDLRLAGAQAAMPALVPAGAPLPVSPPPPEPSTAPRPSSRLDDMPAGENGTDAVPPDEGAGGEEPPEGQAVPPVEGATPTPLPADSDGTRTEASSAAWRQTCDAYLAGGHWAADFAATSVGLAPAISETDGAGDGAVLAGLAAAIGGWRWRLAASDSDRRRRPQLAAP